MDRPPTPRDLRVISWQLGRPPGGVIAIARECRWGFPQVTVNHPLRRRDDSFEVFPTLFWLTCPYLVAEVGRIEARGAVKEFEALLERDPSLRGEYLRAHGAYRSERLTLLSEEELAFLRGKGALDSVLTGIAGLRNPLRVKCLHAQLAHYLARGSNPIGRAVSEEIGELSCPDARCKRALG